jgi:hypothetical protein
MLRLADLEAFVVRAKGSTYVGSGSTAESSRLGSHDLAFIAMSGSIATATSAARISLVKRRSGFELNPGLRTTTATSPAGLDRRGPSRSNDQGCPVGAVSTGALSGRL